VCRLPAIAPAPQQKGGDAGAFRGELQPAARHCRKRPDLADHGEDAGSAQPLFHRPQDLRIARRPDQHDAPGIEPVRSKSWPVKIRASKAPQHQAPSHSGGRAGVEPPEDGRGKGGGERAIFFIAACSKDFVQGASREAAARQYPVDRRDAERQDPTRRHR